MSDVKKEIKFNNSMTSDKRNENFAYLRKNVLPTKTDGLYPSKDFIDLEVDVPSGYYVMDILGSDKYPFKIKAILSDNADVIFRNVTGGGSTNNSLPSGVRYRASAFGTDGVYVLGSDKNVYRVNHTNGQTPLIGALAGNPSVDVGGWDGKFYWWAGNNGIWQQLPGAGGTQIMTTIGETILKIAFLNNQMVLVYKSGADIGVLFWDKISTSAFDKRIIVKNSTYLAMGVVDGTLMLVRSVGNSANAKEYEGEIVVAGYDGENFKTLNSIRAGRRDVTNPSNESGQNCDVGSEVMLFSVQKNSRTGVNQDLGQNYIYKVKKDGSIEAQYLPEARDGIYDFARIVRVFYDFTLYVVESSTEPTKIYSNTDTNYEYSNYANYSTTEYITPFLCNSFNDHKLDGFSVTFEKMFKNTDSAGTPPYVRIDFINVANLDFTTLTLNWTKATDQVTPQGDLEYSVYKSSTGNINTITDITTNGTLIKNWTKDINTFNVTGLADDTDHYFNVLVRDTAGNMSKYEMIMAHTPLTTLVTAWTSPTKNGEVVFVGTPLDKMTNPENMYSEDGSFAVSSQGDGKYSTFYGFGSFVPLGATIYGIEVKVKGKVDDDESSALIYSHKAINASGGKTDLATNTAIQSNAMSSSLASYTFGGSTYVWNTTWTPAELNSDDFGFIVSGNKSSSPTPTIYSFDILQVRVFYTI